MFHRNRFDWLARFFRPGPRVRARKKKGTGRPQATIAQQEDG